MKKLFSLVIAFVLLFFTPVSSMAFSIEKIQKISM